MDSPQENHEMAAYPTGKPVKTHEIHRKTMKNSIYSWVNVRFVSVNGVNAWPMYVDVEIRSLNNS
jgi:hypothetical protein